jgi:undecaprenyl-diphosphatase
MSKNTSRNTILFALSLAFLAFFFITILLINLGFFQKTNELINSYFSTSSNSFLIGFFLILSFLFDPLSILLISFLLFVLLFFKKFKKESLLFVASSFLGGLLIFLAKEFIQSVRPENLYETGFSFPSGHATISIILFCNLIYFSFNHMKKNNSFLVSSFSLFLIFLVGFSRIYLGVHWFSDILGGVFLGLFVFFLILSFFESFLINLGTKKA